MTQPRGSIVDSSVTPYYHCISRCVRRAFLCGEGHADRKQWIEDRLRELAGIFAIEVCGYAVLDNHMHVVLRLNDQQAASWSAEEVVRRWGQLFPPRGKDRQPLDVSETWVAQMLNDEAWVAQARERLNSLGWFMKCLKEPLARLANREDDCKGTFWESRFKSIAILDDEALLTTLAYVDLNVLAAGMAETPEESPHTSVKARLDHCRDTGRLEDIVNQPPDRTRHDTVQEDADHWLVPIEDRRDRGSSAASVRAADGSEPTEPEQTAASHDQPQRAGISDRMTLASYLRLLDWSSRLFRPGKRRVPQEVADILGRLGSSAALWEQRLEKLRERERAFGTVFATRRAAINQFAQQRGLTRLANLNGCPG